MKRSILFIAVLSLLNSACKKKEVETPQPQEPKDEFVYRDFSPDVSIQSVNSFTNITQPCAHVVPFPGDSSALYKLDVNSDNVPDYEFNVRHNLYTGAEHCGNCPVHEYYVTLKSLGNENLIAVNSKE